MKREKITSFIPPRESNFADWYTSVAFNSGLFIYGPTKGTIIFRPYCFKIWKNIQFFIDQAFAKLNVENAYFPMLIPKSLFAKEWNQIKGFNPELAIVNKIGDNVLTEKLFIRPTSESIVCDYFAKTTKSYRDFPVKINQWCNIVRCEKNSRPFLRNNEFLWQELHSIHTSPQEAIHFSTEIINIYIDLLEDKLNIPILTGIKSEHEKFSGAKKTWTIEAIMQDGKILQCGTSHYFGTLFSKIFNIQFLNQLQKNKYAYSVSAGISTRLIGAIIMSHADDQGLVLPFKIAPIQFEIIVVKKNYPKINQYVKKIIHALDDYQIKINQDDQLKNFGQKIKNWEVKGIPFLIIIGKNELKFKTIELRNRLTPEKKNIKLTSLKKEIIENINDYSNQLFTTTKEKQNIFIKKIVNYQDFVARIRKKDLVTYLPFCNQEKCEIEIKEKFGYTARCLKSQITRQKCFFCSNQTNQNFYFAKAY